MLGRFANLFKGGNSGFPATDAQGLDFDDPAAFNYGLGDSTGNRGGSAFNRPNPFRNFSGENALQGFKSLLDVSNAMGDRRQGSYRQTGFSGLGGLFGGSRGTGGMQLSSGPFGTTTYFPDTSSQGGGGQGGGGQKPSRMAKAISGCAAGSIFGPWGCAVGGGLGFLS